MANKKSLGDIVREEVQKPQQPIESTVETTVETPPTPASSTSTHSKNPTKADLEQMVAELKSTLEEAQDNECTFQEKVIELQALLQDKDELITELKQDLEPIDQLKQELEEAQKTVLQLSEVNSELMQEIETLKTSKTAQTALKPTQPQKTNLPQLAHRPEHALTQPTGDQDFAQNTWLL